MTRLHPCTGCRFFFGDWEHNRCCNYIFLTGHRRPCPPGEGCTAKELLPAYRRSWRRYTTRRPPPAVLKKKCNWCGKEFTTTYGAKRYCCDSCRMTARNHRKYARKKERQ